MRTSSVEEWWNVCGRPFPLLVKGVKGVPFRENLFEEERFLIPKVPVENGRTEFRAIVSLQVSHVSSVLGGLWFGVWL